MNQEIVDKVSASLLELEQALLKQDPQMKTHLAAIHQNLQQYPECVALLSEEQVNTLVRGLEDYAGVKVVTAKAAKSSKSTAALKRLSADDL